MCFASTKKTWFLKFLTMTPEVPDVSITSALFLSSKPFLLNNRSKQAHRSKSPTVSQPIIDFCPPSRSLKSPHPSVRHYLFLIIMNSHTEPTTTLPRLCNESALNQQLHCYNSTKLTSNSDSTKTFTIAFPGTRNITIYPSSHTKQVGSVDAFGDGKGAAKITSSHPLPEPKPTAISRQTMERASIVPNRQFGSVPAFGDEPGAATLTSSSTVAEPMPRAIITQIAERDAWVQNVTPTKVAPFTTLITMVQNHKPRYPSGAPFENRDVSIQTTPADPGSFDSGRFPPVTTTYDTRVIPAEINGTVSLIHRHNHTSNECTHRRNDTEHRTHHRFNHTKTVTEIVTAFPQLRTHNSSRPVTLSGSVPTLDSHYTQMTYHHNQAYQPSQTANLGSFEPVIPEISHHPVSSQAISSHSISSQASQATPAPNFISIVLLFYIAVAGIVLLAALVDWVQYMLSSQGQNKPLEESRAKKGAAILKPTRNERKRNSADRDWEDSERQAAERSARMWEETKKQREETQGTTAKESYS